MDGACDIHNKNRIFKDTKQGSFHSIMKNLEYMSFQDRRKVGINCVILPSDCNKLTKIFNFIRDLKFKDLNFYPVFQYNLWKKRDISVFKSAFAKFTKYYCALFSKSKEHPDDKFILRGLFHLVKYKNCTKMHDCKELIVDPNGNFYPCSICQDMSDKEKSKWIIGDVKRGFDFTRRNNIFNAVHKYFQRNYSNEMLKSEFPYFCPMSAYLWAKGHRKNCKKVITFFLIFSKIYKVNFSKILNKLKRNTYFKKLYELS